MRLFEGSYDGFAHFYMIAKFGVDLYGERQVQIAAGAILDEADVLAAVDGFALVDPNDDSAGNQARNEPYSELLVGVIRRFNAHENVLVMGAAVGLGSAQEFAQSMLAERDYACDWRPLHVHV